MSPPSPDTPPALLAAILVEALDPAGLIFVARDDARAARIAAIAAAFAPEAASNPVVIHLPARDALPGDAASAGNIGKRGAALRALREGGPVLLVTSAEAIALRYPAPTRPDARWPRLAEGEPIDPATLAERAAALGYVADERVDEPGEIAVRGASIDLFPAHADQPVRIEVVDGRIAALARYDAVTQRTHTRIESVELAPACEQPVTDGVPLIAYLGRPNLACDPDVSRMRDQFFRLARDTFNGAAPLLVDAAAWSAATDGLPVMEHPEAAEPPPRFVEARDPLRAFADFAREALAHGPLLLAGSGRDLRFLRARVEAALGLTIEPVADWAAAVAAHDGDLLQLVAPVERGFRHKRITVVAAADLLGGRAGATAAHANPFDLAGELRPGDVVVHESFGLGTIAGIETLADGSDAIALTYAKGGHLVPISEADKIWRYGAEAQGVTLDSLDGARWRKRRGAIDAAIAESARALVALAATRDARVVDPIRPGADYQRFAAGFPFSETADQAHAIAAVLHDLASGKPMDRLVIGDVGYGKTEIALRAAAAVALAGRQVALAAPTTVLVRQHLETFRARFAEVGIEVAGLSRLSSGAEKKRVAAGLADGSIRIVIGTAAVAGKGVDYADLALVIIDEEQRFGAADKAKLASLGNAHVLSLSATPIPRTLQAAMIGLQSLSVIATPPARRRPIRTTIGSWEEDAVTAALRRERARGGQSFVVVPRIEDMAPLAGALARWLPELKIVEAHGKLAAADLDAAMVGFARGEGDVLLATNIIEAGLDVPRANTMIVHHADRFGLSQLHQLRGRVGRGSRRGEILLTTARDAAIAEATLNRLKTLAAFDRLGAGFAISARDLDLRGAGDLVGDAQTGHMKLIGVDLYQHLFARALRAARGEIIDEWTPELHLEQGGRLPVDWIPELATRIGLYARLARLGDASALDSFEAELEDRFGAVPDEARQLLWLARLRLLARAAGIARIDAGAAAIALTPHGHRAMPEGLALEAKGTRWLLHEAIAEPDARAARVAALLEEITAAGRAKAAR